MADEFMVDVLKGQHSDRGGRKSINIVGAGSRAQEKLSNEEVLCLS